MARQIHISRILNPVGSFTGVVTSNLALQHFRAAELFRDQVKQIENSHHSEEFGPFFDDIRSYCIACVLTSVASMETLINELFLDPGTGLRQLVSDFENVFWERGGIEWWPILDKYQYALKLRNAKLLDKGGPLYQNAAALIELRNFLTHYKPAREPETQRVVRLEELLKGKFALSPFPDAGADFVAKRCMSAGAAQWAVETSRALIREFYSRTGLGAKKLTAFF